MKKAGGAATVTDYLASLPEERRALVRTVRAAVKKAMPKGYKEVFAFGQISWVVPLTVLPKTYNGQPLCYVSLGGHRSHVALYLMGPYGSAPLRKKLADGYKARGLRLDMGKACLRFASLDKVALDVVAEVIAAVPMATYVSMYRAVKG